MKNLITQVLRKIGIAKILKFETKEVIKEQRR